MSLLLKYSIKFSGDCDSIILTNETGDLAPDNLTGYGAPNPERGDITSATCVITYPDSTQSDPVDLTLPDVGDVSVLTAESLGLDSLPEGIYSILITEETATNSYIKTIRVLNYCLTQCCLDKLIADTDISDCSCAEDALKKIIMLNGYLMMASNAASCNKTNKAKKLLKAAQDLCNSKSCNCS